MKNLLIERAIKKTLENKEVVSINNIVINSLFFSGGTVDESDVEKYLNDNYFLFKNGYYLFIESEDIVYLNSSPLKVVNDTTLEFTYKFAKTKVKAKDGLKGLRQHMQENKSINDLFFFSLNSLIKNHELKYNLNK